MRKRRTLWLLLALALFLLAALLMRGEESATRKLRREAEQIRIPRSPTSEELERMARRRTLPQTLRAAPEEEPRRVLRDPLLRVVPPVGPKEDVVVVEANAIRHSPLGERFVSCVSERMKLKLEELREQAGFDPFEDIDRVAVTEKGAYVSGRFAGLGAVLGPDVEGQPVGERGVVYVRGHESLAVWNDEILVISEDEAAARAALERLEHPDPDQVPPIAESDAYGEMYGRISPETLLELLPPETRERIQEKLARAAQRIDVRATVDDAVGLVATVQGDESEELTDLGKSLGAALAVGRLLAKSEGNEDLAEILELARVRTGYQGIDAELALPAAVLDKHLARVCADVPEQ